MNDHTDDFENELRRLALRPPSQSLEGNIAAILDRPDLRRSAGGWWQRFGFNRPLAALGWGLCSPILTAAVVLLLVDRPSSPRPPAALPESVDRETNSANPPAGVLAARPAEAAQATSVLYETRDEGVVLDGRREPVHRVRYRSADLVQWRNPDTGAQWAVSYPREDVLLVPVRAE